MMWIRWSPAAEPLRAEASPGRKWRARIYSGQQMPAGRVQANDYLLALGDCDAEPRGSSSTTLSLSLSALFCFLALCHIISLFILSFSPFSFSPLLTQDIEGSPGV